MFPYDYAQTPPSRSTIPSWHTQFLQEGNVEHIRGSGRQRLSDRNVADVLFIIWKKSSPKCKTERVTLEHTPINDTANFTQLFAIIPIQEEKTACNHKLGQDETVKSGADCQNQPEGMSEYLSKIIFSDECIFCLNGSVYTQNVRIGVPNARYKGEKPFS